jgi:hypothetical protein
VHREGSRAAVFRHFAPSPPETETRLSSTPLGIALPVFPVMPIGYVAGRMGVFGEPACRAMTFFTVNFAVPVSPFRKPATTALPATLPWGKISAFYLAVSSCTGRAPTTTDGWHVCDRGCRGWLPHSHPASSFFC